MFATMRVGEMVVISCTSMSFLCDCYGDDYDDGLKPTFNRSATVRGW